MHTDLELCSPMTIELLSKQLQLFSTNVLVAAERYRVFKDLFFQRLASIRNFKASLVITIFLFMTY